MSAIKSITDSAEINRHLPSKASQALVDFVENVALKRSRYLFTTRASGILFAHCTHCKRTYTPALLLGPLKHNEEQLCEKCGSLCIVKDSWRGRSRLVDEAYIVWYSKSEIDPKSVVAQGIHVCRDYSGDYKDVNTLISAPICAYLFKPGDPRSKGKERFGRGHMFKRGWIDGHRPGLIATRSVYSEREIYAKRMPLYISEANISEAVAGTQLQYSQWQKFYSVLEEDEAAWHGWNTFTRRAGEAVSDMAKFFDLATRYPCVEYLAKLGLHEIIRFKILNYETYKVINWRGASMEKVLQMSKDEAKELQTALQIVEDFSPLSLYSYRFHRHHKDGGIQVSFEQAHKLRDLTLETSLSTIKHIPLPYTSIAKYVLKQMARQQSPYKKAHDVVIAWRDYLDACKKLGMRMKSEAVLYPNDLHRAHDKAVTKVKYKEDKSLNDLIVKRLGQLVEKYRFESNNLIIQPAVDTVELFKEGKELGHCVGGYAKRYANGECDILLVRTTTEPGKPFYTMEIRNNAIIQCRGKGNKDMTPEVREFVQAFTDQKLKKKKARVKVAARQEVAV